MLFLLDLAVVICGYLYTFCVGLSPTDGATCLREEIL